MKFMDFHPPERPAALLGPQKPIVFLRETKVLGRAGARGGAGAERGGNDSNLVKLTKSLGMFHENHQNCDFDLKTAPFSLGIHSVCSLGPKQHTLVKIPIPI